MDFPSITTGKESSCQCRRLREADSIPGSERSPGAGNCTLLQYSCLENPTDRGTRWATVHRTTMYGLCDSQCESEMTERTQTPYGLSQEIGYNSLCYTIRPGYIPILYNSLHLPATKSQSIPLPLLSPPWQPQVWSLGLNLFHKCSLTPHFRFHILSDITFVLLFLTYLT